MNEKNIIAAAGPSFPFRLEMCGDKLVHQFQPINKKIKLKLK